MDGIFQVSTPTVVSWNGERRANPRVVGCVLPVSQPSQQVAYICGVSRVVVQVVSLARIASKVVKLERRSVVILLQGAEPVQVLVISSSVQQINECVGRRKVLVDWEGHLEVKVQGEFVVLRSRHSHGVVHADLVHLVACKDSIVRLYLFRLQKRK